MRWTEKRNFETVLNAIAKNTVQVDELITEVIELAHFEKIYGDIGTSKSIASLLDYSKTQSYSNNIRISTNKSTSSKKGIAIVGAGNFTKMTMLPAFKGLDADLKYIVSAGGLSGTTLSKKFNIENSSTDLRSVLGDDAVNTVIITTRHNLHAPMVIETLHAGKNVFVEKPLAINPGELQDIIGAYEGQKNVLTVGFNRRFAPHAIKMKEVLGSSTPMNVIATMNAGAIPPEVWVHDLKVGGGRIIGEACHFIDLISYLTGSKVISVCMNAMGTHPEESTDNASILLKYENGSNGVINYFANGSKSYSKERVEVYSQERTLILDNWRKLKAYGFKGFSGSKSKMDKGHRNQFRLLVDSINKTGSALIPMDSIVNTTRASFAAIESLKNGSWIDVR